MEGHVESREHGTKSRSAFRPHVHERAAHRVVSAQIVLWRRYEAFFSWLLILAWPASLVGLSWRLDILKGSIAFAQSELSKSPVDDNR